METFPGLNKHWQIVALGGGRASTGRPKTSRDAIPNAAERKAVHLRSCAKNEFLFKKFTGQKDDGTTTDLPAWEPGFTASQVIHTQGSRFVLSLTCNFTYQCGLSLTHSN